MEAIKQPPIYELMNSFDDNEVWVPVYSNPKYEVSSWGKVRRAGAVIKPCISNGYEIVSLSDGKHKNYRVHRLVVLSFIGPAPFEGAIVAHNDGNKQNNRLSNLRWASALENQADAKRHGNRPNGSKIYGSKLVESDIPKIKQMISEGKRYPFIAERFGVSVSTISLIYLNKIWKHIPDKG